MVDELSKKKTAVHEATDVMCAEDVQILNTKIQKSGIESKFPEANTPAITSQLVHDLIEKRSRVEAKRISLSISYPELRFLLYLNDIGILPKGDIFGIRGKAKQGKTHALLCFIVALIKGRYIGFTSPMNQIRILLIDTEQNPLNVAKIIRKIHLLSGLDPDKDDDRLVALSLRDENHKDRVAITEEAIAAYRPDIVFIDGLRDLVADFNSIDESQYIINELMRWSKEYDCGIMNVMHVGKVEAAGMRGHAGAELLNKAAEVWNVTRDGNTITVEQTDCRNRPADSWSFFLDTDGIPQPIEVEKPLSRQDQYRIKVCENLALILMDNRGLSYSELSREYQELAGCKEPTANKAIGAGVKFKFIQKTTNGHYYLSKAM